MLAHGRYDACMEMLGMYCDIVTGRQHTECNLSKVQRKDVRF